MCILPFPFWGDFLILLKHKILPSFSKGFSSLLLFFFYSSLLVCDLVSLPFLFLAALSCSPSLLFLLAIPSSLSFLLLLLASLSCFSLLLLLVACPWCSTLSLLCCFSLLFPPAVIPGYFPFLLFLVASPLHTGTMGGFKTTSLRSGARPAVHCCALINSAAKEVNTFHVIN